MNEVNQDLSKAPRRGDEAWLLGLACGWQRAATSEMEALQSDSHPGITERPARALTAGCVGLRLYRRLTSLGDRTVLAPL